MFPTLDVLQKAVTLGRNLIIAHEPTFYGHLDETEALEREDDAVFVLKRDFIEKHGLIIWRSHDHWHWRQPDGILIGMVKALGWQDYQSQAHDQVFRLPENTLEQLAAQLKTVLNIRTLRVGAMLGLK